ncbi:MAG: NfeD family protein [Opitutales bacterium]
MYCLSRLALPGLCSLAALLAAPFTSALTTLTLSGQLEDADVRELASQLEAVSPEAEEPLAVAFGPYLNFDGDFDTAVELRDALRSWNGPLVVYLEHEALGPPAVIVLSADEVFAAPRSVVSLSATVAGESRQLPGLLQARIRAGVPDVPWRLELTRAMLQVEREAEVAGITKPEEEAMVLTGREAAEVYDENPLLASGLHDSFEAFLQARFGDAAAEAKPLAEKAEALAAESGINETADTVASANDESPDPGDEAEAEATSREGADDSMAAEEAQLTMDADADHRAYVVPIEGAIMEPQLYILRRAIRDAIADGVDTLVISLDTPGGAAFIMLEMMEALDRFEGTTIAYIDNEATSAGAFIAIVCDHIYFAPSGTMGSAAIIQGDGTEVPPTMKAKIMSFINARVRSATDEYRYRYEVMRAMSEVGYELVIDGETIGDGTGLLNLTAQEAVEEYGRPPQPLLAQGIADDVDGLLTAVFQGETYTFERFEVNWSESFAKWFSGIAPILISIGFLLIIVEIYSPGFGVPGITGISLIVVVYLSQYFAGLAGYEPLIFLVLGLILIAIEVFVTPGIGILLAAGVVSLLASLLFALGEVWPTEGIMPEFTPEGLTGAMWDMFWIFLIVSAGMFAIFRYLPGTPLGQRIALKGAVETPSLNDTTATETFRGREATVIRALRPTGEIEIDGQRFPAHTLRGMIEAGETVIIVEKQPFSFLVRESEA